MHNQERFVEFVIKIKEIFEEGKIIAGNVVTGEMTEQLILSGVDVVKVGIGPGSICTTRVVAGVGVPQLSAVYASVRAARETGKHIIADGGIRYSGDVVKALVAGASCVMMGSVFAGTSEAPGEIIEFSGQKFKEYVGMGSQGAMEASADSRKRYSQGDKFVAEGVESRVPFKGPVGDIIYQYV